MKVQLLNQPSVEKAGLRLHTDSVCRWHDVVLVTDPAALGVVMGRGEGGIDKAFETYAPINKMCDPHGQVNHSHRPSIVVSAFGLQCGIASEPRCPRLQ